MSIEIHIHEETADAARQTMLALLGNAMSERERAVDPPPQAEKKGKAKTTEPPKGADPTAPVPPPSTPGAGTGADYKPVGELILKAVGAAGRDAVVAILKTYGAKLGSDLKPSQYVEVSAALRALIDGK